MKKSILVFSAVIITISVMAFSFINRNKSEIITDTVLVANTPTEKIDPKIFTDFIYDVGTRFQPITKSELLKATSISDFNSPETMNSIVTLKSVSLIIVKNERQTDVQEIGFTEHLTVNQLKLLKEIDYNTQFNVRSEFTVKNLETGEIENNYDSPHLSVVPEKQAEYIKGKKALMAFLIANSKEVIKNVDPEKLQPAKLYFTVTKNGSITNVRLDRSSNYPEIDKFMEGLIQNTPDTWIPAENSKGEKVDQELVVSFGLMGC